MSRKNWALDCTEAFLNEAHREANSNAVRGGSFGSGGSPPNAPTSASAVEPLALLLAAEAGPAAPAAGAGGVALDEVALE